MKRRKRLKSSLLLVLGLSVARNDRLPHNGIHLGVVISCRLVAVGAVVVQLSIVQGVVEVMWVGENVRDLLLLLGRCWRWKVANIVVMGRDLVVLGNAVARR